MHHARRSRQERLRPKLIALSVAACFSLSATESLANPAGASGDPKTFSVSQSGNMLTITNSANAIINWQSFSIGVGEITRFLQTSAGSAVLNRVVGSGRSDILGALQSYIDSAGTVVGGRVFLLNPNGILIGAGAKIDVGGLVASSLNLSDQDFQNGRMHFTEVPGAGGVVNNGIITAASGGRVFLVGPDVQNTGSISAPNGQIVLAAGKSVDLVSEDSPYVTVKVTADSEQALNLGSLIVDAGRIDMSGALVRNAGVVSANSAVAGANGEIRLVATKDLTLDAGSKTTANGPSGGDILLQAQTGTNLISGTVEAKGSSGTGGTVQALGVRVGVIGNGVIDASGDTGGGTVLVGGDAHGGNANVQNAQQALIGSNGIIRADAGTTGDGGRVVVWSDDYTQFYGSISARGGSRSGNGGFVETSGKLGLNVDGGRVDTRAANGQWGTWLLDPTDVIIAPTGDSAGQPLFYGSGFGVDTNGEPAHITEDTIESGFNTSGQVTIQAGHDVSFATDLNLAYATAGGTFTVQAMNNIDLAGHTITTNGQNVRLGANVDGNGSLSSTLNFTPTPTEPITGSIIGGGNIVTDSGGAYGGNITLSGYAVNVGTLETKGGLEAGNVSITALNGGVHVTGSITTTGVNGTDGAPNVAATSGSNGGQVNINATGGAVSVDGDITTNGGRGGNAFSVNCDCASPSSGGSGGSAGSVTITADSSITTGSVTTHGGGGGAGADDLGYGATSGGSGGSGGSVNLTSYGGDATVNGMIDTSAGSGASGGSTSSPEAQRFAGDGGFGGQAGSVNITGGTVTINGAITAQGGNGGAGGSASGAGAIAGSGGDGAEGGSVMLTGSVGVSVTGMIDTSAGSGGNGGASDSGNSGSGGFGGDNSFISGVGIYGGSISVGSIITRGGSGGSAGDGGTFGGGAGDGGAVDLEATGPVTVRGFIDTSGGAGGSAGASGEAGRGGAGGALTINGSSMLVTGNIMTRGGDAGSGGDGGEGGGAGGAIGLIATAGSATIGDIDASGGAGGSGGFAGNGGSGANNVGVSIGSVNGDVTVGAITTSGGAGGSANASDNSGGSGGYGGGVSVFAISSTGGVGGTITAGPITSRGGDGGAGGPDIGNGAGNGGSGGTGGSASINNFSGSVFRGDVAGPPPSPVALVFGKVALGNIDTSGGNGGVGGKGVGSLSLAGDGGNGGNAGGVAIYGGSIDLTKGGTILAMPGNGGAGGSGDPGNGGTGGNAATVSLSSDSTILVLKPLAINGMTFASTPLTTTSIAGGVGGAGGVDVTGAVGLTGATGTAGTIDIFGQIVIVDPLSILDVALAYNGVTDGTGKSTQGSLNPDDQKKKDDDTKKGAAVCK